MQCRLMRLLRFGFSIGIAITGIYAPYAFAARQQLPAPCRLEFDVKGGAGTPDATAPLEEALSG